MHPSGNDSLVLRLKNGDISDPAELLDCQTQPIYQITNDRRRSFIYDNLDVHYAVTKDFDMSSKIKITSGGRGVGFLSAGLIWSGNILSAFALVWKRGYLEIWVCFDMLTEECPMMNVGGLLQVMLSDAH